LPTCREVSELATDYMEHALPLRRWLGVRMHLFACRMCRNYLDQLRKTTRLVRRGALPAPVQEVEARLVRAATTVAPGDTS
jgi:predicted anti-sigma-YlaC factor YlaD